MTRLLDETHDASLRSWVESANQAGTDFPIQNLPLGVFRLPSGRPRLGVAIGDEVVDLPACLEAGSLDGLDPELQQACLASDLTPLMGLGGEHWRALRRRLSQLLRHGSTEREGVVLAKMDQVELLMPATVGDYTDFYASVHHATNVGRLFRPDNPLLPNYKYVPIGYHGRASSLVASGSGVVRPCGQRKGAGDEAPSFGPSALLDYELEVGFFVGPGTRLGETIPLAQAESRIFGLCLVNDWSARDLQAWEYQPLGPFLAKSFATSLSPWVVTLDALAPFRCPAYLRDQGDPQPLDYLAEPDPASAGIGLQVEVLLRTAESAKGGRDPFPLSSASFENMYWTIGQMLAHHASNGCPLVAGDLMASGTVSGPEQGMLGSLLEITRRGQQPLELPNGETRTLLEDGDEVILRARCARDGARTIGFGECRGVVLPSS
jgi:fumarylacetoacetase